MILLFDRVDCNKGRDQINYVKIKGLILEENSSIVERLLTI